MIGQHDSASTDPDCRCAAGHVAYDERGCSTGDAGHVVMLGQPIATISKALGMAREIEGIAEGIGCRSLLDDGREIEDRAGDHGWNPTGGSPPPVCLSPRNAFANRGMYGTIPPAGPLGR